MTDQPQKKCIRVKSFSDFLPGHKIHINGNTELVNAGSDEKRRLSLCVGCNSQIHDQYILRVAPDLEWHAACLKCAECNQYLDENCTCFVRDGKTYCKIDYVRKFGTKCDKCGLCFGKNDYVMRARSKIYHPDCFRCIACGRQLVPGDEFALREDGLLCRDDHEVLEKSVNGENSLATPPAVTPIHHEASNSGFLENSPHFGFRNFLRDDETEMADSSESTVVTQPSMKREGRGNGKSGEGKPTRVRTVLNEKQLHTLRTCYAANPRPDALMKEQLVEMTSLSPRVIRVWFQNKRCKDKKKAILMKQIQQQEKEGRKMGYVSMHGIPMIASSPVRHESPLGLNGVEVHSYQPPWKALSDFALHTDLDRLDPSAPPFQQLVNQMHGYELMHNGVDMGMAQTPTDLSHHDSTDSYVTYGESDDSINQDMPSP